jgi:hypothetical protein
MLVLWSVAINCVGPLLSDWYSEWQDNEPMPYLYEYILVILADSVGQVAISFYFSLQHNRFIKACCFADSSTSKKPEQVTCAEVSCARPLSCCRWAFTGLTRCWMGFWQCFYRVLCQGLPLGITILFFTFVLYLFCAFKLWDFATSFLLTIPSARLLEMFRLATVWGLKANFGSARGNLNKETVKRGSRWGNGKPDTGIGLHGDVPPPQLPLLEALREAAKGFGDGADGGGKLLNGAGGAGSSVVAKTAVGDDRSKNKNKNKNKPHNSLDFFHSEADDCSDTLFAAMEQRDISQLQSAIHEAALLLADDDDDDDDDDDSAAAGGGQHAKSKKKKSFFRLDAPKLRQLSKTLAKAKEELLVNELSEKYGAIACVWPPLPPSLTTMEDQMHSGHSGGGGGGSGGGNASPSKNKGGNGKAKAKSGGCCGQSSCFPCGSHAKQNTENGKLLADGASAQLAYSHDGDIEMQQQMDGPMVSSSAARKDEGHEGAAASGQRVSRGSYQQLASYSTLESVPCAEEKGEDDGEWGLFLSHRDGRWPLGLPNEVNTSNDVATNEIEVAMTLALDATATSGQRGSQGARGKRTTAATDESALVLGEREWAALVPALIEGQVFAFPLNPMKQLAHRQNFFDVYHKIAEDKKKRFEPLSHHDRYYLNHLKAEVEGAVDQIAARANPQHCGCLP